MPPHEFRGWPPCDACGGPVEDPRRATLSLDTRAAGRRARAARLRTEEATTTDASGIGVLTLSDLVRVGLPDAEPWRWLHDRCRPDTHRYEISGERLDTLGKALSWTLHLQQKTWFQPAPWEGAVRRFWNVPDA